jgi:hypothetical protein
MFSRFLDRVAVALGRVNFSDLVREAGFILRDMKRKPAFEVNRAGHGTVVPFLGYVGAISGQLAAFRFVIWPGGLGDNPIVHPASVTLLFGPWRRVAVRIGRYSVFTHDGKGNYGYVRVWRYSSLPEHIREGVSRNWITRRDLGGTPMLFRVGVADIPVPHDPCDGCGESFPYFELEESYGRPGMFCADCVAAFEEAEAEDRWTYGDQDEWDERMSSQINGWDEVYA